MLYSYGKKQFTKACYRGRLNWYQRLAMEFYLFWRDFLKP